MRKKKMAKEEHSEVFPEKSRSLFLYAAGPREGAGLTIFAGGDSNRGFLPIIILRGSVEHTMNCGASWLS